MRGQGGDSNPSLAKKRDRRERLNLYNELVKEGLIAHYEKTTGIASINNSRYFLKDGSGKVFGGVQAFVDTESIFIDVFGSMSPCATMAMELRCWLRKSLRLLRTDILHWWISELSSRGFLYQTGLRAHW